MPFAELLAVFAVDVNCQLSLKRHRCTSVCSVCAEHTVSLFLAHMHTCCPIAIPIAS